MVKGLKCSLPVASIPQASQSSEEISNIEDATETETEICCLSTYNEVIKSITTHDYIKCEFIKQLKVTFFFFSSKFSMRNGYIISAVQ